MSSVDIKPDMGSEPGGRGGKRKAEPDDTGLFAKKGRDDVPALLVKIVCLGLVIGVAAALTPTLVGQEKWGFLVAIWAIAAVLVGTYATHRALPAKYLVPGTLMLVLFVVYPIVMTAQASFTNVGDGTRNTKEETVNSIVGGSVVQTEDAPRYNLTVATEGSVTDGPFVFLLVSQDDGSTYVGTADGLEETSDVTVEGDRITEAEGYTILTPQEVNDAQAALAEFTVPTENGAIRQLGISTAFEGTTVLEYDEAADTITDTQTGTVYSVQQDGLKEFYVAEDGTRVSDQSWKANVGFANYKTLFTDPRIRNDFFKIFLWTFAFATLSVVGTFLMGLLFAFTLNDPRLRGQKIYRALLIIPYAIPGFISLLLWSSFYNKDFGLINEITGLNVNWFGGTWSAKFAVLLTNLWMGFPYMFLVSHRRAAGDPRGPHRGGEDRRRQRLRRLPQDHLPAAAGHGGAAPGGDVRLQLQQLRGDLPAHRGRTVQCR